MDGTRNLTITNIHQFAGAIKLTEPETEYFEVLVLWNQAETRIERKYYKNRATHLRASKIVRQERVRLKELGRYPYLPAILCAAHGMPANSAVSEIAGKFGLSAVTVAAVIEKLRMEKILEVMDERLQLTQNYFVQVDNLQSDADHKHFLRAQLDLSSRALENRYSRDAKFYAHTFTAEADRMPMIAKKIREMLEQVTLESGEDAPEKVVQINVQLFPLNS